MTITNLDRAAIRLLRDEMQAALNAVAKKHGLGIEFGRCTFDRNGRNATYKLEVATKGDGGQTQDRYAVAYEQQAVLWGLPADGLGRKFKGHRENSEYTIVGLNPNARSNPVIAENGNGKKYIFPIDVVLAGLGKKTKPSSGAKVFSNKSKVSAMWSDGDWYDAIVLTGPTSAGAYRVLFVEDDIEYVTNQVRARK